MVRAMTLECEQQAQSQRAPPWSCSSAASAQHPTFGEAGLVETSVALGPTFANDLPRVEHRGGPP